MRLVALLFLTIGCAGVVDPFEAEQLHRAQSRWESKEIHDYTYEMRTSCFCGQEVIEWAVIEVRNDQIVSARTLTGEPLTGFGLSSRKTVDGLFEVAKQRPDWLANIDFDFDSELGYPLRISLESKRNIADAGATYEARNLKPITQ